MAAELPPHEFRPAEGNKQSFEIEFASIGERDAARDALAAAGLRFRTSKTLVPFRITGNIEWGVRAPVIDGVEGLTVWCWPESLWAPISFTITINDEQGMPRTQLARLLVLRRRAGLPVHWPGQPVLLRCGPAGAVGGVAPRRSVRRGSRLPDAPDHACGEPPHAVWQEEGLLVGRGEAAHGRGAAGALHARAAARPLPGARARPEIRRLFSQALRPGPGQGATDPRYADPVLKEGALLTNVFNRLARSCFYEAQKNFDGCMPLGAVTPEVRRRAFEALLDYEERMHKVELHRVISVCDEFIRWSNKRWAGRHPRGRRRRARMRSCAAPGAGGTRSTCCAWRRCSCTPWCRSGCREDLRLPKLRVRRLLQLELRLRVQRTSCAAAGEIDCRARHRIRELPSASSTSPRSTRASTSKAILPEQ